MNAALLRNVGLVREELRQDLEAGDHVRGEIAGQDVDRMQYAVHAPRHGQPVFTGKKCTSLAAALRPPANTESTSCDT